MLNFYFGLSGRVRRTSATLGTLVLQALGVAAVYLWSMHVGIPIFDDPHNRILAPEIKPVFGLAAGVLLWSSSAVLWKRVNDVDEDLQERFTFVKLIYPMLAALYFAVIMIGDVRFGEYNADLAGIPLLLVWMFVIYLPPEPCENQFGLNPRSAVLAELEAAAHSSPLEARMQKIGPASRGANVPRSSPRPGSRPASRSASGVNHAMSGFGKRVRQAS
ncbi:MAG: hypothetical protein AAF724_04735 [Pseudomonadota bacterium]